MAITEQHPSVLKLTKTEAALVDPTLPESSEHSLASMTELMTDRKNSLSLAIFGGIAGLVLGTLLREWAFRTFAIPRDLGTVLGMIVIAVLIAAGFYPFYARKYKLDQQLQVFANGPHAINIGYLNDSGLTATDDTSSDPLWRVASSYRAVTETVAELRRFGGRVSDDSVAVQQRLSVQLDALDADASAAGVTLDIARYQTHLA